MNLVFPSMQVRLSIWFGAFPAHIYWVRRDSCKLSQSQPSTRKKHILRRRYTCTPLCPMNSLRAMVRCASAMASAMWRHRLQSLQLESITAMLRQMVARKLVHDNTHLGWTTVAKEVALSENILLQCPQATISPDHICAQITSFPRTICDFFPKQRSDLAETLLGSYLLSNKLVFESRIARRRHLPRLA